MRFRTFLIAAMLVGGFVWLTTRPGAPVAKRVSQAFSRDSGEPLWSGPNVAHSAGLGSDELNNIEIYKNAKDSVAYVTSTVYQTNFFFEQVPVREMGSGFLINGDGQILTNNHVISGSSQIEVTLPDQSQYKAKILVRDRVNDLALIKIEPRKKLTYLTLGNSDALQVGQKVLAIGNPFGFLQGTLTVGVVSSLARTIKNENGENLEGIIQTDAAINSGNSGGPLLDSQGYVVGINTAIYSPNGGNLGIGFAMPINRAKAMLDDYRAGRKPATRLIGVSVWPVSGDLAEALRLPASGGLLIVRVTRGSAADRAGLRGPNEVVVVGNTQVPIGGDLITQIDGKAAEEADAITKAISRKHAGESLNLKVWRNGRTVDLSIVLGDASEERF
jgi:S1-C subfamily serine protease